MNLSFWARFAVLMLALLAGQCVSWLIEYRDNLGVGATLAMADTCAAEPLTLNDVCSGKAKIVDLAWPLNAQSAFWPGDNYQPFELKTIATLEKDGVLSKAFSMPEHLGTHIDAPNHFEANQPAVHQLDPQGLFAPGVVIDVTSQVAGNEDYQLSLADTQAWEKQHGEIPTGAVAMLYTGWSRHWKNVPRYQNRDVMGRLHFPGYSPEAARFLVEERSIRGLGIDTLSIDPGLSRDFAVHHIVNRAARYGLENVANLDQLPPRGFHLFIAPIKIESGTGGPTRIFAILPR
jgi:kynurenine formamidase